MDNQATNWLYSFGQKVIAAATLDSALTPYALMVYPVIPAGGEASGENGSEFNFGTQLLQGVLFALAFLCLLVILLAFMIRRLLGRSASRSAEGKEWAALETSDAYQEPSKNRGTKVSYAFYFIMAAVSIAAVCFTFVTSVDLNRSLAHLIDDVYDVAVPRLSEDVLQYMRTVTNSNADLFKYVLDAGSQDISFQVDKLWRNESNAKILPLILPAENDTQAYNLLNFTTQAAELQKALNQSQQHYDVMRQSRIELYQMVELGLPELQSHFQKIFVNSSEVGQYGEQLQYILQVLSSIDAGSSNQSLKNGPYFNVTLIDIAMAEFNQSVSQLIPESSKSEEHRALQYLGDQLYNQLGNPSQLKRLVALRMLGYTEAVYSNETVQFGGLLGSMVDQLVAGLQFGVTRCQVSLKSEQDIPAESQHQGIREIVLFNGLVNMMRIVRNYLVPVVFGISAAALLSYLLGLLFGCPRRATSVGTKQTLSPTGMKAVLTLIVIFAVIASFGIAGFFTPSTALSYGSCQDRPLFFPSNYNTSSADGSSQSSSAQSQQAEKQWFQNDIPSCAACNQDNLFFGWNKFKDSANNVLKQNVNVSQALSLTEQDSVIMMTVIAKQQMNIKGLVDGTRNSAKVSPPNNRAYRDGRNGWISQLNGIKAELQRNANNADAIKFVDNLSLAAQTISNNTELLYQNLQEFKTQLDAAIKPIEQISNTFGDLTDKIQAQFGAIVDEMDGQIVKPAVVRFSAVPPMDPSVQCPSQRSNSSISAEAQAVYQNASVIFENALCDQAQVSLVKTFGSIILVAIVSIPLSFLTLGLQK
ncbi:hypothetical protein MP228_007860 [Amoeboaphelidium protococcarum]|nr:hypothetical protein MP228_007860 [Amoeboaphelidium protococcarum]